MMKSTKSKTSMRFHFCPEYQCKTFILVGEVGIIVTTLWETFRGQIPEVPVIFFGMVVAGIVMTIMTGRSDCWHRPLKNRLLEYLPIEVIEKE